MSTRAQDAAQITTTVFFEGQLLVTNQGESLASVLLRSGRLAQTTDRDGEPRGHYCGMGICHDCRVIVDGRLGMRACMTRAETGMVVRRHPRRPSILEPFGELAAPPIAAKPHRTVDILIVGAGPGGLAAAEAARAAGASVLLVDERAQPGGQFFKQPAVLGLVRDSQSERGARLIRRVCDSGVEILPSTLVWGAERMPDGRLQIGCLIGERSVSICPRIVVVATGSFEAAAILPGWTLCRVSWRTPIAI
jgi:ferredoxin